MKDSLRGHIFVVPKFITLTPAGHGLKSNNIIFRIVFELNFRTSFFFISYILLHLSILLSLFGCRNGGRQRVNFLIMFNSMHNPNQRATKYQQKKKIVKVHKDFRFNSNKPCSVKLSWNSTDLSAKQSI